MQSPKVIQPGWDGPVKLVSREIYDLERCNLTKGWNKASGEGILRKVEVLEILQRNKGGEFQLSDQA